MKTFHVSSVGRLQAVILIVTLLLFALYAARKALGLWAGITAKSSDAYIFNLDLNTTVPAALLTLLALAGLAVIWYLLVEQLTIVRLSDGGMLVATPGYRIFYRWNEVRALDIISGPAEDSTVTLSVEIREDEKDAPMSETVAQTHDDKIAAYLSEADLREDKKLRDRNRQTKKVRSARINARATRPDGRPLPFWVRLLYPQALQPDRLLLYPGLENRNSILGEIEKKLS